MRRHHGWGGTPRRGRPSRPTLLSSGHAPHLPVLSAAVCPQRHSQGALLTTDSHRSSSPEPLLWILPCSACGSQGHGNDVQSPGAGPLRFCVFDTWGWVILYCGAVLGTPLSRCGSPPSPRRDNRKQLQTFLNVPRPSSQTPHVENLPHGRRS